MNSLWIFISAHLIPLILLFAFVFASLYILFTTNKSQWIIYFLLIWFPLESVLLRYTPIEYYSWVKYLPEALLYLVTLFSFVRYILNTSRANWRNPLIAWFVAYLVVALMSFWINDYRAFIWLAGMRQLLRFVAVFFFALFENFNEEVLKKIMLVALGVVVVEAVLGIVQYFAGGRLDNYLFFDQAFNYGGNLGDEGVQEFWAKGQRVFATLGRYDRLGSFLASGFLMMFPWIYFVKEKSQKIILYFSLAVVAAAIVLTYSRASWMAFVVGILVVGYFVWKDKRVLHLGLWSIGILASVLALIVITRGFGVAAVDQPNQTLSGRALEAVSYYSWQQSYEGYGRVFFIINTPLMVTRYYPLFGVGPGNYGSGAAAALGNDLFYSRLHLPFGIQNNYGQIDNNWWSILGESGILGLICWVGIFLELIIGSIFIFKKSDQPFEKVFGGGFVGVCVGLMIMGFFGPYFEFRALMFYFWLWAGMMICLWRKFKYQWNFLK